jgi:hypothetical protein
MHNAGQKACEQPRNSSEKVPKPLETKWLYQLTDPPAKARSGSFHAMQIALMIADLDGCAPPTADPLASPHSQGHVETEQLTSYSHSSAALETADVGGGRVSGIAFYIATAAPPTGVETNEPLAKTRERLARSGCLEGRRSIQPRQQVRLAPQPLLQQPGPPIQ